MILSALRFRSRKYNGASTCRAPPLREPRTCLKDVSQQADHCPNSTSQPRPDVPDFRVIIDFGTTFTTIAVVQSDNPDGTVYTIEGFTGDRIRGRNGTQVLTEIWYSTDGTTKKKASTSTASPATLFGYQITRRLELAETDPISCTIYHKSGLILKPKLLLDDNARLKVLKKGLLETLTQLKKQKVIAKNEDFITDLLS
jgi:hypothetical protein